MEEEEDTPLFKCFRSPLASIFPRGTASHPVEFYSKLFLIQVCVSSSSFIRADVKHGDWATQGRILNYSFFGSLFYGNLKLFSEIKESVVDEN